MVQSASQSIESFNTRREPERLAMKMLAMRSNAFSFLRGTCHLFHQRMAEQHLVPAGPSAWICGDLHLENFGTYLGANGLTYFDVNDFDETIAAPHTLDILRLATSILVAAPVVGLKPASAKAHARHLIDSYLEELATGKSRWLERRTATGPIGDLMENLKKRTTLRLLEKRTVLKSGRRMLNDDGIKTLPCTKADRDELAALIEALPKIHAHPKALNVLDAARRIAGTGSLGLPRFVILVEGAGSPDGNWLLDLKAAQPSALAPYVTTPQPAWPTEAARVAAIETLFQANTPDLLSAQVLRGQSFVLKEMQPSADRLQLATVAKRDDDFGRVVETMAQLTAWGHLRGSGRYGAATADALVAAAQKTRAATDLLERATALADLNAADWAQFCQTQPAAAADAGATIE
jgi:uncharacterized protein (DUF2252 family)